MCLKIHFLHGKFLKFGWEKTQLSPFRRVENESTPSAEPIEAGHLELTNSSPPDGPPRHWANLLYKANVDYHIPASREKHTPLCTARM